MKLRPVLPLATLAASCVLAAPISCNSIFTKSAPVDTSDKPYEFVEVVGSNIPQRVVKGQQPMTPSPVRIVSAESWREAMEKVQGTVNARRP